MKKNLTKEAQTIAPVNFAMCLNLVVNITFKRFSVSIMFIF